MSNKIILSYLCTVCDSEYNITEIKLPVYLHTEDIQKYAVCPNCPKEINQSSMYVYLKNKIDEDNPCGTPGEADGL